jgi:hypothetical protein
VLGEEVEVFDGSRSYLSRTKEWPAQKIPGNGEVTALGCAVANRLLDVTERKKSLAFFNCRSH